MPEKRSIADRIERQEFWTQIMRDTRRPVYVRLKASEYLAKSEGDFEPRITSSTVVVEYEKNPCDDPESPCGSEGSTEEIEKL
jgi:hypothetical protein